MSGVTGMILLHIILLTGAAVAIDMYIKGLWLELFLPSKTPLGAYLQKAYFH